MFPQVFGSRSEYKKNVLAYVNVAFYDKFFELKFLNGM